MSKAKKYRLCVYLIKENCTNHDGILKNRSSLLRYSFKNRITDEIALYVKSSSTYVPRWVELFTNYLDSEIRDLFNSSSAAVLIIKHNGRYFVFTFGYGRNLLNLDCVEESFGLRAALNSIDPDKVRSIDVKTIDTAIRHAKVQTSQASSVDDFGMNIDRDILNGVTGKSNDEFLGTTISGSIAVYLNFPLTFDNLGELCTRLLEKYHDESYKRNFAWVDYIKEIRITGLVHRLNNELMKAIRQKDFEHIFLAVPQVVDWEQFEGFKYRESDELEEDISIKDTFPLDEQIEEKDIFNRLKRKDVLYIGRGNQIIYHWPLYKCINYEFKENGETYLLTSGKWFKIDTDYVSSVNSDLAEIEKYKKFSFPKYAEKREDEYNKKVYQNNQKTCFLMDKKNIHYGGGRSTIEFCDLIINKTDFAHIKRFRGSSTLSHLFFQGANSARLFLSSLGFRKEVNEYLPDEWKFTTSVIPSDYEIVFAIISKAKEGVKDILPFFSKISFLQIYNQLRLYRYKVSITKIEM